MMKAFATILSVFLIVCAAAQQRPADSLKNELNKAHEDTIKALLYAGLSRTYVFSTPDSAFYYAGEGLRLSRQINFAHGIAGNLFELSIYFRLTGASYQSMRYATEALAIFETIGNAEGVIHCTNMLAWLAQDQREYRRSLDYAFKALSLSRQHKNYRIGYAYTTLGESYGHLDKLDSALLYAEKAENMPESYIWNLRVLGDINSSLNNDGTSLSYYRKALTDYTAAKDSADIYIGMAKVFNRTGQTDSATHYLKAALRTATEGNFLFEVQQASEMLAKIYRADDHGDSVLKYMQISTEAKDSLFSQEKVKQFQSFVFNEKLRQQEAESEKLQYRSRIRTNVLLIVVGFFLLLAVILFRNNKVKQIANFRLRQQKEEIQHTLAELRATQAQLVQKEKMASLGELTAGIAHEIQNPLNFMNNFSETNKELIEELQAAAQAGTVQEVIALASDIRANEEKIAHHGKRADAIVKGMLQHARTSTGEKQPTDINSLVDEYLRLNFQGMRAKDQAFSVAIETHFNDSIGAVNIVPQDIGRVLLNLFNNAFYAVQVKKQQLNGTYEPTVSVSTKREGNTVVITVRDNGTGMSQKVADKVFQPFFTTKPTGEGTGLGLSLSYDIITKGHGGNLTVKSTEGEGSEFIVQLPA